MSRTIKTWRDPYDVGFSLCRKTEVTFKPGVTVLVGCNGSGKSTMLHNIKEKLKKENIPFFEYDNEKDGGANSISEQLFLGNTVYGAAAICSSEGENITLNLGRIAKKWWNFLVSGDDGDRHKELENIFSGKEDKEVVNKERWILLDALDSGYSIDNVIDMKELFRLVLEDARRMGLELYIIISSNEYELVDGADCFDVMEGKYINFMDYKDYKKFILHTREKKNKRYKK